MVKPVYFDSHMHTPLCKHAYGHPREYAEYGRERGLKGVIVTCHSPMPNRFSAAVRMEPEEFDQYVGLVEHTAWELEDDFEVRLGMESDFFPGMEPWLEELHQRADFHYILGSVHYHVAEYIEMFFRGDVFDFQVQFFDHLAESAETGLFDALAHPDLVKNAAPEEWDFERLVPVIDEALDRIAATDTAMELNTSGLNKPIPEMNPGPEMLKMMRAKEIPVVLGSDSHVPERVGADFGYALDCLSEAGYEKVHFFEEREPRAVEIDRIRPSLRDTEVSSSAMDTVV